LFRSVKKHKKKKKHKKRDPIGNEDEVSNQEAKEEFKLVKLKGTGRILSSGTTVMGQVGTKFLLELSVGDAIIIQHPTSLVEETRIIKMVLSDISASMR
jgi:hypothetical protein